MLRPHLIRKTSNPASSDASATGHRVFSSAKGPPDLSLNRTARRPRFTRRSLGAGLIWLVRPHGRRHQGFGRASVSIGVGLRAYHPPRCSNRSGIWEMSARNNAVHLDARGLHVSTASAKAAAAFDHLVTGYLSYRRMHRLLANELIAM